MVFTIVGLGLNAQKKYDIVASVWLSYHPDEQSKIFRYCFK